MGNDPRLDLATKPITPFSGTPGAVRTLLLALASFLSLGCSQGVTPPTAGETREGYPKIANLYGSQLGYLSWDQGSEYWKKLSLIIGVGSYDFWNDWDKLEPGAVPDRLVENIKSLKEVRPDILILPYVDVTDAIATAVLPDGFLVTQGGAPVQSWPGMYRVDTSRADVLAYDRRKVGDFIEGSDLFDGVYLDVWNPDPVLCQGLVTDFPGKILMTNFAGIDSTAYPWANGVMSEDGINALNGDFDQFVGKYIDWCNKSRRPGTTTIVCHPATMNVDQWRWAILSQAERDAEKEAARMDEQTMRFGLTTALLGDGYFAYDAGWMARGDWWWYKEYDCEIGAALGDATRSADGHWSREYEKGTIVVNPGPTETRVDFAEPREDASTGYVQYRHYIPPKDGRILRKTLVPPVVISGFAVAVSLEPYGNPEMDLSGGGALNRNQSLSASASSLFDSYAWFLDSAPTSLGGESRLVLDLSVLSYGEHCLTLLVSRDGAYFSERLRFSIGAAQ